MRERRFFRFQEWRLPICEYRGIAHRVRTSVSGLRHELMLVHPEPQKCVLLHTADELPQPTVDRAATLLRLPEIPAIELYGPKRTQGSRPTAVILSGSEAA